MPKGLASDPSSDKRRSSGKPIWKREDPPQDQIEEHERMSGRPRGAWGKFLAWCQAHPNEFYRSHAIMAQQTAVNAASEIKKWIFISGQSRLNRGPKDGWWETYWGHAPDDNMLENWYVWVKWIDPNLLTLKELKEMDPDFKGSRDDLTKHLIVARTGSPVQTRRKAQPTTKKAGVRGTK